MSRYCLLLLLVLFQSRPLSALMLEGLETQWKKVVLSKTPPIADLEIDPDVLGLWPQFLRANLTWRRFAHPKLLAAWDSIERGHVNREGCPGTLLTFAFEGHSNLREKAYRIAEVILAGSSGLSRYPIIPDSNNRGTYCLTGTGIYFDKFELSELLAHSAGEAYAVVQFEAFGPSTLEWSYPSEAHYNVRKFNRVSLPNYPERVVDSVGSRLTSASPVPSQYSVVTLILRRLPDEAFTPAVRVRERASLPTENVLDLPRNQEAFRYTEEFLRWVPIGFTIVPSPNSTILYQSAQNIVFEWNSSRPNLARLRQAEGLIVDEVITTPQAAFDLASNDPPTGQRSGIKPDTRTPVIPIFALTPNEGPWHMNNEASQ